ncbi:MAG: DUF1330 domain-containing protein [Gammaproteobacteria bacterium]|jgi:uncharacterized protein (DUF1330 family)|nr:DUF1330 domain-containing protein [Gammaproteobacteria bacterium]|tara:strand:- start:111 stop:425 length:315 start_codon:yes stop_codon:yes gene_type:complete
MSDVEVYMIANLVVEDANEYRKYEKGFFPILKKFGGEFVTFDDRHENFEGEFPLEGRVIIFKFPSEELAKQWYNDDDYQTLSEFRRAGTTLKSITLVHGLPPRA